MVCQTVNVVGIFDMRAGVSPRVFFPLLFDEVQNGESVGLVERISKKYQFVILRASAVSFEKI